MCKAGEMVTTLRLVWMKIFKFTNLPFKTDIPEAVAFFVFLRVASSIRELMCSSEKLSNFEKAEAVAETMV